MTSYHFYEGKKNEIDKILILLHEFGEEFPSLGYPSFDMLKLKSRVLYFIEHGKLILINDVNKNKLVGLAILHQTDEIEGNLGLWCETHWVDEGNNFVSKGHCPNIDYWDWDLETRTWEFQHERFWNVVRAERNLRLNRCDWTQFDDASLTEAQKEEWKNYRQVLRDLPSQYDTIQSMNAIAWPTPPNNEVIEVTIW